jgi:hypothetical protein
LIVLTKAPVEDLPNLGEILQGYVNDRVLQKDIPEHMMRDHGVQVRSVIR